MGIFLCIQPNRLRKTGGKPPVNRRFCPQKRRFWDFELAIYSFLRVNINFFENFHFIWRKRRRFSQKEPLYTRVCPGKNAENE